MALKKPKGRKRPTAKKPVDNKAAKKKGSQKQVAKKPVKKGSPKSGRPTKTAPRKPKKSKLTVGVPTNRKDKLVDHRIMRKHNFLSSTESTLTRIYPMTHVEGNRYAVDDKESCVSAIMKLSLGVIQTNELSETWSLILWNITQRDDMLPDGVTVTFTRSFERKDNESTRKAIVRRRRLAVLSSESEENIKQQSISVGHDLGLIRAIDTGDSVVSFGAEAIVTARDDKSLEQAVAAIQNYLSSNDETRGLKYELDINKQSRPFITYGPNVAVGNRDVFVDMTSEDAAISALFVDSGGDRSLGSEYVGVSVGKLIRSHAAYNFVNTRSMFIGNDADGNTHTIGGVFKEPSQIYLSKVASRAYLLSGKSVAHFVVDNSASVESLMSMPIADHRKVVVDVSKGLLNILEAIDNGEVAANPERVLGRFPTHINNIISLLSQFRDTSRISTTDEFASIARDILIDFFVANKYWSYDARHDLADIRLIGVRHEHFKKLSDFGQYVSQRKRSNKDARVEEALFELDNIINRNILPTIPSLDTHTADVIDDLVRARYRVVDLTGMSVGSMRNVTNPALNVNMISYLNLMLPTLSNGDAIFIHGISGLSHIAKVIDDMITSSGKNIDVIYTESNQSSALDALSNMEDSVDLTMIDLYNNRVDRLIDRFSMDSDWVQALSNNSGAFFVKSGKSVDYIYLDSIL